MPLLCAPLCWDVACPIIVKPTLLTGADCLVQLPPNATGWAHPSSLTCGFVILVVLLNWSFFAVMTTDPGRVGPEVQEGIMHINAWVMRTYCSSAYPSVLDTVRACAHCGAGIHRYRTGQRPASTAPVCAHHATCDCSSLQWTPLPRDDYTAIKHMLCRDDIRILRSC